MRAMSILSIAVLAMASMLFSEENESTTGGEQIVKENSESSPSEAIDTIETETSSPSLANQRETDLAFAPPVGEEHLGRPYNKHFNSIGTSIFPEANVIKTPMDEMSSNAFVVDNTFSLALNAEGWGIGSAEVGGSYSKRYAVYRVYQISKVLELDDTAPMADVPDDAVYYLWRIYMGHIYEMLLEGSELTFTAQVKANFYVADAGIETFASQNKLKTKTWGRGLAPKNGNAIFAKPSEVSDFYTTDEAAEAPIFIQYRIIPGREPPEVTEFSFRKPFDNAGEYRVEINSAKLSKADAAGYAWDIDEGPEPYVIVMLDTCHLSNKMFKTTIANEKNTHEPVWEYSKSVLLTPQNKLCLHVYDKDYWNDDDFIGECVSKPLSEYTGNRIELSGCGSVKEIVLVVH